MFVSTKCFIVQISNIHSGLKFYCLNLSGMEYDVAVWKGFDNWTLHKFHSCYNCQVSVQSYIMVNKCLISFGLLVIIPSFAGSDCVIMMLTLCCTHVCVYFLLLFCSACLCVIIFYGQCCLIRKVTDGLID